MTRAEALAIVEGMLGWDDIRIVEEEDGELNISAVEPTTHRRMYYDPRTGYFV